MSEIEMNATEENNGYQVIVTSITWNPKSTRAYHSGRDAKTELPTMITYDIPTGVLREARGKKNVFNDVIESYIYRSLTNKFGHEVYHCQIWLPLEEAV